MFIYTAVRGCHGRDRMVVVFTTLPMQSVPMSLKL
jgi:hypothetical protein